MSKLTLTPDELEQLGCTPEEGAELEARDRRTQRAAKLARLAADLPKLRARADFKRDIDGRDLNGIQYGQAKVYASSTPESPDDVAVLVQDSGRSLHLDETLTLPKGRVLHFITREQFEALEPEQGFGEPGWERRLVFCQEWHADLRAMIKAGVADPIHDAGKGRERYHWESENDPANIDAFVAAVVASTTDRDLLEGWLDAAGDQQHAIAIRERLDAVFGTSAPDFWGGKDDKKRFASPVGHYSIGTRG